uniref:Axonemal dynein light intermediate polypeptide 1 n=1 Tax=Labrus bergylta TaxID=56723 RepID=A0A3Q3FQA6_9LABR
TSRISLKHDNPVLISKSTDRKSPKGRPLKVSPQQEILNAIVPPREWTDGTQLWVQQVSSAPCTRTDVIHLEELLDSKLQQRQARQTGICPVRRELYSQYFDELIRQVTIDCAERGRLLSRVRDEIQMTIAAYRTLNENSVAFGMRKALQSESKVDMEKKVRTFTFLLSKEATEQTQVFNSAIEKRETERPQIEEKKHVEEIQFFKRTNLQLKVTFQGFIPHKYIFPLHLFL